MDFNMNSRKLGDIGEELAADYLSKKGYQILDRNYVPKWIKQGKKEIDIVAKRKGTLVFIEVKSARELEGFSPEDKVNFQKQKKIIRTAESYILEKKINPDIKWQIDVIAIEFNNDIQKPKIRHIENAVSSTP